MASLSPLWSPQAVQARLMTLFGPEADPALALVSLTPHRTVYACRWQGRDCMLKLSARPGINEAETLAWQWLGSRLPVPEVYAEGVAGEVSWLLQARAAGVPLGSLSAAEQEAYWPALWDLLRDLLSAPLPRWPLAQSRREPWPAFLRRPLLLAQAQPGLRACREEPALFKQLFSRLEAGLSSVKGSVKYSGSGPQWLLHGDFKPDNLIVSAGRIQGLIDWHESRSGDFVFDFAKLLTYQSPEALPAQLALYRSVLPAELGDAPDLVLRLETCLVSLSAHKLIRYGEYGPEDAQHYRERLAWVARLLPVLDRLKRA